MLRIRGYFLPGVKPTGFMIHVSIFLPSKLGYQKSSGVTSWRFARSESFTHVNDSLLAKRQLVTPEDFCYPSFDGKQIKPWIMKPVGFTPGKKSHLHPTIHGGPLTDHLH